MNREVSARFAPSFVYRNANTSNIESFLIGYETIAANDSGSEPAIILSAYRRTNAQALSAMATRPLLDLRNLSTVVMRFLANGNMGLGGETSPDQVIQITKSQNSGMGIHIENVNTGSSGQAIVQAESNGGSSYFGAGSVASSFEGGGFFYTASNVPLSFWTNNTKRVHIPGTGGMGVGTVPQSTGLHVNDGVGSMMFVTKTSIDGTPQIVIANGAGDVAQAMYFTAVIRTSGGANFGTSNVLANNSSLTIYSSGSDTLRLRVNADGSVDVTRTGGTLTYSVVLFMIWR